MTEEYYGAGNVEDSESSKYSSKVISVSDVAFFDLHFLSTHDRCSHMKTIFDD